MSAPERDHADLLAGDCANCEASYRLCSMLTEDGSSPCCARCKHEADPERDHEALAEGELRHRNDLARDVAREWAIEGWCLEVPPSLEAALDRLAAAYLPDSPQDELR